ncbi:MAG: chlorhexidine efflux transporter [Pseudomonadota bacterium]
MIQRSLSHRNLRTFRFETVGLYLVVPLYMALFSSDATHSARLLIAISLIVVVWMPLYNLAFDTVAWRLTQRVASDRSPGARAVHAVVLEVTSTVLTLPAVCHSAAMACRKPW